ncbi:MAG: SCP2 sterol-binding domain-containing protein [Actinobacteria bacterium]|nr:SCP2 sterol-binding domain-containing protein [Actinomycetota bacterium]
MATKKQVEAKLAELIARLDDAGDGVRDTLADALPETKVLEVHITDLDERFWTEMVSGHLGELQEGHPPRRDIRISIPSDDLVELVDGRGSLFSKYLSGHVRIDASVGDLMRLRRLAG